MAGVLNFTLGLGTSQFLSRLGAAGTAVSSFIGLGLSVAKVFREIEDGGRLFDLGQRLSESAGGLFKIEHGLDNVGGNAGNAAPLLQAVNKALGGVNEAGEPTAGVFEQIGLSIEDLTKLNGPEKLLAIGRALSKFNQEQRTAFASKIARGGASDLLAIASDVQGMADSMGEAAQNAGILDRNAARFDKISDSFKNFGRLQTRGFFLGVAEGAGPGLEWLSDTLNQNLNLTKVGQKVGEQLSTLFQAGSAGKFGEMMELNLQLVFTRSGVFFSELLARPSLYTGMGQAMLGALAGVGRALIPMFTAVSNSSFALGQHALEKKLEFFSGGTFQARGVGEIFQESQKRSIDGINKLLGPSDEFSKNVFGFVKDGGKEMGDALAKAWAAAAGSGKDIEARLAAVKASLPPIAGLGGKAGGGGGGGGADTDPMALFSTNFAAVSGGFINKLTANSLERVGASFSRAGANGPANGIERHTRRTAEAAAVTNKLLERVARKLETAEPPIDPWAHID